MSVTILQGDCREMLRTLPEASVQCVVTSPPYWGLRDYGVDGQIGLEPTVQEYVVALVGVFREVRRVLRPDGTLWLNLGDTYVCPGGSHRGHNISHRKRHAEPLPAKQPNRLVRGGLKRKDLAGAPWRVALALQDDGWYLRSDIVWAKPNALPEAVQDRPCRSHEYLFLLAKSPRYYYDAAAVKTPTTGNAHRRGSGLGPKSAAATHVVGRIRANREFCSSVTELVDERNLRTVWSINVACNTEAHFATFPEALVVPCILAGSRAGDLVLDPFAGAGTTGRVAEALGRNSLLVELSPAYVEIAQRATAQTGLFCGGLQ